jgi:hypothetical protein
MLEKVDSKFKVEEVWSLHLSSIKNIPIHNQLLGAIKNCKCDES